MTAKKRKQKEIKSDPDFDSRSNLIGLFTLLLEVDKRVNPENYTLPSRQKNHA